MPAKHATTIIQLRIRCISGSALTAFAAMLALAAGSAAAQSTAEESFDDKENPWREAAIELPAAPRPEHLLPFYVSATATQSFAVDGQSISAGPDGVVRYTLIATSAAGARSVSYEGIRCATYERKLYAFGQPEGAWSRSRRDQWEPISSNAANRRHAALAKDYFCNGKMVAGSAEEITGRLRQQKPLTP